VGLSPPRVRQLAGWAAAPGLRSVTCVLRELFRPWRDVQTWWGLVHLSLDLFIGVGTFTALVTLLALSVSLLIVFPLAVPCIWGLFIVGRLIGHVERSRHEVLLGVELGDPVPPLVGGTWWARLWERVRSGARWREIGYGLLRFPLGVLTSLAVLLVWCGSAALVALPLYVGGLPGGTAKFWLFEVGPGAAAWACTLVGVVGLALAAPWFTVSLVRLDCAAARLLLGTDPNAELDERVTRLETSRMAAVDSAEAERRRIERDLHDGAQARLVALAVDLGRARDRLERRGGDDDATTLVADAHEKAKLALAELRDLARGILPSVLTDRGLDAALSALAAACPVPVTLESDLPVRPSPRIEAAAYFVLSELLANVARHSEATRVDVRIARDGERLVLEVTDDGVGGADPSRGTGLAGLAGRVEAVDGTFSLDSPVGGPTRLRIDLPFV